MVIQRWQTVWLLIAAVLMAVFCFPPMALVTDAPLDSASATFLMPRQMPVLMAVGLLGALLFLVAIFLFKDTRRQRTVTLIGMFLSAAVILTEVLTVYTWDSEAGAIEWMGSVFLPVGAFLFGILAYRGIRHDENLLRAADRLR